MEISVVRGLGFCRGHPWGERDVCTGGSSADLGRVSHRAWYIAFHTDIEYDDFRRGKR